MSSRSTKYSAHDCRSHPAAFVYFALSIMMLLAPLTGVAQTLTLEQWLDLGWDYYNKGEIDEAFNTFLETVANFPDSSEAHLALGEVYLQKGLVERGRNELLASLTLDDESPIAARAHYVYAVSIREEDTWNALLHLERAFHLGGTPALQFEIAHQTRFCRLLTQMQLRSSSGQIVLHYADYIMDQEAGDSLAKSAEGSLYLAERFCYFNVVKPVHFFLYPSERAVQAEIFLESDLRDPVHREFHIVYNPTMDFLPLVSAQVVGDLQEEMNRHAGADWMADALQVAISGLAPWSDTENPQANEPMGIDCDEAVKALNSSGSLVDLVYLVSPDPSEYVPEAVAKAELGSFLGWVRQTFDRGKFQEIVTQPNIELVLSDSMDQIQNRWLEDIAATPSLISDPALAQKWVEEQPVSPLAIGAELPARVLKEGLRLYLGGEKVTGLWEIRRSLDLDPGLALGYYTLGWIAADEGNWSESETELGMATKLFETPEEIAWCHALLAPIYLHDGRWSLAQASLSFVVTYADSETVRARASELLARVTNIIALAPTQPNRDSLEFGHMRDFFQEWNKAANSDEGVKPLVSDLGDPTRSAVLVGFYSTIRENYPSVVFNHAVQAVERIGAAIQVQVRVQAVFPGSSPDLPIDLEPLTEGGYPMYFRVIPGENGSLVLAWESGWFPPARTSDLAPRSLEPTAAE